MSDLAEAFSHRADALYFTRLLCLDAETIDTYADFFDLRPTLAKRREFGRTKRALAADMVARCGTACMLRYADDCDVASGVVLDHLIPLSSNRLNKELRALRTARDAHGKVTKVATQSFGSNRPVNLILACHNCNSLKQNRLLDRDRLRPLVLAAIRRQSSN